MTGEREMTSERAEVIRARRDEEDKVAREAVEVEFLMDSTREFLKGALRAAAQEYVLMQDSQREDLGLDDEGRWVVDDLTSYARGLLLQLVEAGGLR
jgi:hypothetical protein